MAGDGSELRNEQESLSVIVKKCCFYFIILFCLQM